jgi:hypothetical protein
VKTLIKTLLEKENVVLPTNGKDELFTYEDIGITFPTVTFQTPLEEKTIRFDPTALEDADEESATGTGDGRGKFSGGAGMGMGMGMGMGAGDGLGDSGASSGALSPDEDPNVQTVNEFTFVVQMAWTPRSEQERLDARTARVEAEKEANNKPDEDGEAGDLVEDEG